MSLSFHFIQFIGRTKCRINNRSTTDLDEYYIYLNDNSCFVPIIYYNILYMRNDKKAVEHLTNIVLTTKQRWELTKSKYDDQSIISIRSRW